MKIFHLLLVAVGTLLVATSCEVNEFDNDMGTFVKVEAGRFTMGSTQGEVSSEQPAHNVTLTHDFYICTTEVTQAQWVKIMGENPSEIVGDTLPVNNVSFNDIYYFLQKLNSTSSKTYRLPTEAEWEFAARGGNLSEDYEYAGSNDANEVAWFDANSEDELHVPAQKAPNELGIYDMSGNVAEWCADKCVTYTLQDVVDPVGKQGASYCIRGGGFDSDMSYTRSRARNSSAGMKAYYNVGFRLAIGTKIEE